MNLGRICGFQKKEPAETKLDPSCRTGTYPNRRDNVYESPHQVRWEKLVDHRRDGIRSRSHHPGERGDRDRSGNQRARRVFRSNALSKYQQDPESEETGKTETPVTAFHIEKIGKK